MTIAPIFLVVEHAMDPIGAIVIHISRLQRSSGIVLIQTMSFFVLFESAAGYALFSVLESEEVGSLLDEVWS